MLQAPAMYRTASILAQKMRGMCDFHFSWRVVFFKYRIAFFRMDQCQELM